MRACLVKRKIPQLGEDFSFSRLFSFSPLSQIAVSSCSGFFLSHRSPRSPTFVTLGLSTLTLYFKTGRAVCREGQREAGCCGLRSAQHGRPARTGPRTVCKTTLAGLFTAEAPFGGGRGGGRRAGRQGRKERGFTTLKRVGIPPEPFPHLAGSCENNCLAFTLSLCRWSPSYESALRAASGGESGGLVICCTANISILYRDAWFLMLAKLFRVASSLAFLFCSRQISISLFPMYSLYQRIAD